MKKIFLGISVLIMAVLSFSFVYADEPVNLVINGSEVYLDNPPVMIDNRVFVPLRVVCDKMGLTTQWNGETKEITISGKSYFQDTVLGFQIGNYDRSLNGAVIKMDVAPQIIEGVTYIPARYVVEAYNGYSAWWSKTYNTVYICKKLTIKNIDVPEFNGIINCKKLTFDNRPSTYEFYSYDVLYNGSLEKYIKILEDNGYIHTMQPSGQVVTHKLIKNNNIIYMGEDLYNWSMFYTCEYPGIIEIENDSYTAKFPLSLPEK